MRKDSNGFLLPGRHRFREFFGIFWSAFTLVALWKWDYEFWFEYQYWHNRKLLLGMLREGEVKLLSHSFDLNKFSDIEDFTLQIREEKYQDSAWLNYEKDPKSLSPKVTLDQMREGPRECLLGLFISSRTMRKANAECYRLLKVLVENNKS